MKILYGAVGEGLGHATRSRVVAGHLIDQGTRWKMVASGRALPYLKEQLPDVQEIWGTSFVLEQGQVNTWKTVHVERARRCAASRTTGVTGSGSSSRSARTS